LGIRGPQSFS